MKDAKQLIYLDNNSTTKIDERVLLEMMPYLTDNFANANSTHQFGVGAYNAVKNARKIVAETISAETNEIVFTSGATESINLAIKGVADNYSTKGKHIITFTTEHTAVLDTCKFLETKGYEVTYLPTENDGMVNIDLFKSQLRADTILVSIMMVNNETGVIQPIKEIASLTHEIGAIFMTDATQAVGKMNIAVDDLDVDLLCFSGHKIYAPKGIGVLYVRQRKNKIKLPALLHGGGHERGLRSGTLNVSGIVAIGKACELTQIESAQNQNQILELRDYLEEQLLTIEDSFVNGSLENRLYNVTNICFVNADSEAIIMGLSNPENTLPLIAVSNGSACTSTKIEPSHVLLAMGLDENNAYCSIRFSIGKYNTKAEMDTVIENVKSVVTSLRAMRF